MPTRRDEVRGPQPPSEPDGDGTLLAGAVVLVVDDDPVLRWAVVRLLARAGARVHDAGDGDQATAIAATEHVDLLLTDMEMPGHDGAAVALAITSLRPRVAVIFMSGRPRSFHLASGRLLAEDRLVEKPFAPKLLVGTLATALASRPEVAASRGVRDR